MTENWFFDGAMGTYYRALTGSAAPCERANLTDPGAVVSIHRAYLEAGANAIKTNSLSLNPVQFPEEGERRRLTRAAFQNARAAAEGFSARVFADIGRITAEEERDTAEDYLRVTEDFLSLGADAFLFETQDELSPLLPAVRLIKREKPGAVVALSFAVSQDGFSRAGRHYAQLLEGARGTGADLLGLNCVCGPTHMLSLLKRLDLSAGGILAMPNAGYPAMVNGRLEYRDNPAYFAGKLLEIYRAGAKAVGGCCGTTPEHIRQAVSLIRAASGLEPYRPAPAPAASALPPVYSRLGVKLERGEKIVVAEVNPPIDADAEFLLRAARTLGAAGADAVTLPDSPLARPRADSMALSAKVRREAGIEALPHLSCRDRNRIGVQSALLAASIEGIQNVLAITGDPITQEKRNEADAGPDKNVYSLNSVKLISFISGLNDSVFARRPYLVAAALNVNAENFEAELRRARLKEEAGCRLFMTQAIFSAESLENLRLSHETLKTPILAGVLPIASYRNALFLANEVRGISIPADFLKSLENLNEEDVRARSLAFAKDIVRRAEPFCAGYYLMTPLKRLSLIVELIGYIKEEKKC